MATTSKLIERSFIFTDDPNGNRIDAVNNNATFTSDRAVKISGNSLEMLYKVIDTLQRNWYSNTDNTRINIEPERYLTKTSQDNCLLFAKNKRKYSGSGCLIILVDNKSGIEYALLFTSDGLTYNDTGGYISCNVYNPLSIKSDDNILLDNAIKETLEETCDLFNIINKTNYIYNDVPTRINSDNAYYRGHIYKIAFASDKSGDILQIRKKFITNLSIEYKTSQTRDKLEMVDCGLFKIDDLKYAIETHDLNSNVTVTNLFDNKSAQIHNRAKKILTQYFATNNSHSIIATANMIPPSNDKTQYTI